MKKTFGFTLAEVLITLGIIGVVATLTIPAVITRHQKHVVENRLKKFYTNINQAVIMSEVDNGAVVNWNMPANIFQIKDFYLNYFAKYLNIVDGPEIIRLIVSGDESMAEYQTDYLMVKFADGSAMIMRALDGGLEIIFYPFAQKVGDTNIKLGKDEFAFSFNRRGESSLNKKNYVEPFTLAWNGTREYLIGHYRYGCNKTSARKFYCAKLIQLNGWKIPDDYPW